MKNYLIFFVLASFTLPLYTNKITVLPKSSFHLALNKPATFGRTHFIVGYPQENSKKQDNVIIRKNICNVYFSPDDDINKELVTLIHQEQKNICIAVFNFTDSTIAQALIDAKKRGVMIEFITDINCIYDRYNKVDQLSKNDISVLIFDPKQKKAGGIMHHKFALFSNNDDMLVWTGSCNFTRSGCKVNQENALLLNDQKIIEKFVQQFKRIKNQTRLYKPLFAKPIS